MRDRSDFEGWILIVIRSYGVGVVGGVFRIYTS